MNFRSLIKKVIPTKLFRKIEPFGHLLEAVIVQIVYWFPARNLKVIGVTGTDGKTTTSFFITNVLRQAGHKVALMTTTNVDYGDGKGMRENRSRLTTLGAVDLAKELKKIKEGGAEWLVLEVTSHALAQHRIFGIPIQVAVMTNINHEHFDYHGSFERYRAAKLRLFTQCKHNIGGLKTGVVNADDPSANIFEEELPRSLSFGLAKGDIKAKNLKLSGRGNKFDVDIDQKTYSISTQLPGKFNVYNALAAISVGVALKLEPQVIEKGIASLESVEGRMTRVDEGQDFEVIVDYAHTPESFEKLFNTVRPLTSKRLICVFGSAGRRDEAKRSQQGEIAGQMCDLVYATEEDDRDIDGEEILSQIANGAQKAGKVLGENLFLIHDREDAVKAAINAAKNGDIVLLLGKGHEKSILSNGPKAVQLRHQPQDDENPQRVVKRDYNEVLVAEAALKKL
ncbi:MAG TPA: UDP-N-acetylmuramoyl-L-alanyl-D-glutamate--2,6-diaminopimelate ligase [Candidatus Saccharimonadales bacterium]|nr:UDP-N-acetylmuramoyl-L-alanyl-D-glutamate--2,6-diaminopimelate ligase [Candidatus Saccharimonadales bacterium]